MPRITCASTNNALEGFYKNNPTEKGGVLTVDSATVGYVSYQNSDFIATDHVEKVSLRNDAKMNKYIGLFLKTSIDKSKGTKYGYGYKFSQGRIRRQKVLLPTDVAQKPNWQYMEDYVKKEMKSLAGVVADYYEEKIVCEANKLSNSNKMEWSGIRIDDVIDINCEHASSTDKNTVSDSKVSDYLLAYKFATGKERDFDLDDTKWIEFCVDDIFNLIQRGRRLTKKDQIDGQIPYISSTGLNNGLDGFIGNTDKVRMFEDCLTIANSGSVGATFYHRYKFIGSDHITALKIDNATENVYLFLATIIKDLGNKYSFNREINDTRIRREKILLPTRDGKPDYEFMDKFVAIQKIKSIYQVLSYMKSQYLS